MAGPAHHQRMNNVDWAFNEAVARLLGAVLPVQCPGCGRWDERLCDQCAALARGAVLPPRVGADRAGGGDGADPLGVLALGAYEGELRRLILAAKHSSRDDLRGFLLEAGRTLGAAAAREWEPAADVVVVPAPSSWRRRLRGAGITCLIAEGVARGVLEVSRASGVPVRVRVVEALGLKPGARSQSGRSSAQRRSGRSGAMRVRCPIGNADRVLLVDDVVTTGATALEMRRCLPAASTMLCLACAEAPTAPSSV